MESKESTKRWRLANKERILEYNKEYRRKLRLDNLEHYRKQERESKRRYEQEHSHPCPVCGKMIRAKSTSCNRHKPHPTGSNSPCWRGGRQKTVLGYMKIYKPEHPRADSKKQVYEHIVVWEDAHGKPVPQGWIIHHLNGIKDDNRIANLVALPHKKHERLLEEKAKRIQQLEAQLANQHQLL